MEHGYFHPSRGYWQTTNEPRTVTLAGYPEGTVSVPLKPSGLHEWANDAWTAPTIDPSVALATERGAMVCSPMQGILTLGEPEWAKVVAYRDTQAAWAEKVVIDSALDWRRTSQNIAFFQFLLGYTDAQVDDLFRAAMQVTV